MIVTSCSTTVSPAFVSSQLPPESPAMSTITEPGAMRLTASAVTSSGARLPGTCAVVMTMSTLAITSASAARCCSCSSSVSWRA